MPTCFIPIDLLRALLISGWAAKNHIPSSHFLPHLCKYVSCSVLNVTSESFFSSLENPEPMIVHISDSR